MYTIPKHLCLGLSPVALRGPQDDHIVPPRCLSTPAAGTVASALAAPVLIAIMICDTGIQIASHATL